MVEKLGMGNEFLDNGVSEEEVNGETEDEIPANKVVYIQLRYCFDDKAEIKASEGIIKGITLTPDVTCKMVRKQLLSEFNIQDSSLVLKLRNQRESIIPLSYSIPENTYTKPYILEICNRYQNVTPFERTVSVPTYEQVLKRKLRSINSRISKLENFAPTLPDKQAVKIDEEIRDINEKMNVLDRKLKDADETQWQGMFKRNPLW